MFSQESRSRCALGERVGTRHPLLLSRWSSAGPPCTSHKPSWCSVASDSIAEITHAAKALVDYVGSVIALRFPCPVAAHSASKRRQPPRRSVSTRRMNSRMSRNTSEAWDYERLKIGPKESKERSYSGYNCSNSEQAQLHHAQGGSCCGGGGGCHCRDSCGCSGG